MRGTTTHRCGPRSAGLTSRNRRQANTGEITHTTMLRKPLPPPPSPGPEGQVSAPGTASARETSLEAPDAPAKASDALQASAPGSPPPTVTSSTAQPGSDADGASPRRATSGPLGLYAAPATGGTGPQNGSDSSIPKALASAEADAAYSPAPAGSAGIAGMSTNTMTNSSSLQQQPLTGGSTRAWGAWAPCHRVLCRL